MMKALIPSFIGELEEYVQNLESDIIELETNNSKEMLNKVFRAFHSIKGSSGIIGFKRLSQFTHKAEFLLEEARSGRFNITSDFIDVLLTCNRIYNEFLAGMIGVDINSEEDIINEELSNLIEITENELIKFGSTDKSKSKKDKVSETQIEKKEVIKERYYEISVVLRQNIYDNGLDPLGYFNELLENGTYIRIKANMQKIRPLQEFEPRKHYLSWEILYKTNKTRADIEHTFLFLLEDNNIDIQDVTDLVEKTSKGDINTLLKELDEKDIVFPSLLNEDEEFINKEIEILYPLEEDIEEEEDKTTPIIDNEQPLIIKKSEEKPISIDNKKIDLTSKSRIESQFIKVDIIKIDELVKLVGEMVIGYSQMMQSITELIPQSWEQTEVYTTVESFHRTIRDIQDKVMKVRMIPIGPTFSQFKLLIRDYSLKLNKKVNLEMYGEDTELDKRIIEVISDPLRHMVRNAVDHGIEDKDERVSKGKPEIGTIQLFAYHEEGNMVIEIVDDGRGLNKEKILNKAIEKGLYDPRKGTILEENEIFNFIFEPGFSTAETVSDLSGRGVGMDVVKNNIESIRGKVYVSSKEGVGSTFKIVLPLTVSIIDGMIFKVGEKLFILPLLSITELVRPESRIIKRVEGKADVINLRGEFLPLLKLYEEFKLEANIKNPTEAITLIIESEGRKYGIMVDELIGQQQVVIKPIDPIFEKVKGITGASILGNGKVALILDAPSLIRASSAKSVL